jgi:hypothetical protein
MGGNHFAVCNRATTGDDQEIISKDIEEYTGNLSVMKVLTFDQRQTNCKNTGITTS